MVACERTFLALRHQEGFFCDIILRVRDIILHSSATWKCKLES